MAWRQIFWDDGPDGNIEHIAEHGLSMEDVEAILSTFDSLDRSRSSDNLIVFGWLDDGRRIAVVLEEIDEDTVFPVTAYEVK